ncbi:MAG: TIGR03617 family F420-dependent LLM class oxidoreductase [Ilumatobacteraceae bacterium]
MDTQLRSFAGAAAEAAELAEAGIDGVFTFEGPHDGFVPLTLAAPAASVDLYTNVAIALPRNPMQLAYLANDLQLLSGGRFRLGLGSQIKPQIEKRFGAAFDPPVARMREMVLALRAIFGAWATGERLRFEGDFYRHTLMTPMFNPGPNPHGPPPIWLGALGPKMTQMAAEVSDGLLVMPFSTEKFFTEHTLPNLEIGLARGGRTRPDITVISQAIVCAYRDEAEKATAEMGVKGLLSFYGSTPAYRPVLEAHGWGDLHLELNTLSKQGRWIDMIGLIDDDILNTIAVCGTPSDVATKLTSRFEGTADRVAFYLPFATPTGLIGEIVDSTSH